MKRTECIKRSISIFVSAMFALTILCGRVTTLAEGDKPYWADDRTWPKYVSSNTLRVYDGEHYGWGVDLTKLKMTDDQVLRVLNQGDIVHVARWGDEHPWAAVVLEDGTLGMVAKVGLSPLWAGFVTSSSLKVRSSTNSTATVVKTLYKDEMVKVLTVKGAWAKVEYWDTKRPNTTTGWVAKEYITKTAPENHERKMAQDMLKMINSERAKDGLSILKGDNEILNRAAEIRARELTQSFSHIRPNGEYGSSSVTELSLGRGLSVTENILYTFDSKAPIETGMESLMKSTGHRNNIMASENKYVGIGVYQEKGADYCRTYVVQLFAD